MAFAYCYSNLSSKNSTDFLTKLNKAFPFKIERIQTDNGSEFHKYFHEFLSKNNIIHYYYYSREPQQNSYIEIFNRTMQEEFLYTYAYDLSNISLLNTNIIKYFIFYNTQRPNLSIKLSTPIDFFIFNDNFSNMYRTHAFFRFIMIMCFHSFKIKCIIMLPYNYRQYSFTPESILPLKIEINPISNLSKNSSIARQINLILFHSLIIIPSLNLSAHHPH